MDGSVLNLLLILPLLQSVTKRFFFTFSKIPSHLEKPRYKTPEISVPTPPNRIRPVTCNSNDSSSNGSSSRIFIKGLPLSTTEGFLAKTFSRFGTVTNAKIITERSSKQSLGFAYVWFDCEEAVQLAVEDMDGKFVDGRFVAVTLARPESPTSHVRFHFFDQIGTFPIGPEFTPNMRGL